MCLTYLLMQTFMVPGTLGLSLLFGALFGPYLGFVITALTSTSGSTLCYMLSRAIGEMHSGYAGRSVHVQVGSGGCVMLCLGCAICCLCFRTFCMCTQSCLCQVVSVRATSTHSRTLAALPAPAALSNLCTCLHTVPLRCSAGGCPVPCPPGLLSSGGGVTTRPAAELHALPEGHTSAA